MPVCVVKGCSNRSSQKNRGQEELEKTMKITLHAFPKCTMKRQLWLNSLGLQNADLPKYAAVCSVHFRHNDLDRTSLVCVRLRENAIPYVKFPEIIKEENINVREEISTEAPLTSACLDSYNTSSVVIKVETDDSIGFDESMSITGGERHFVNTDSYEDSEEELKIKSEFENECVDALLQTSDKSTEAKVSLVDKHTCISPTRLFNSPSKQLLREHISKLKKRHQLELKALKDKIKRRDKKITDLQTILQTLKKKNLL